MEAKTKKTSEGGEGGKEVERQTDRQRDEVTKQLTWCFTPSQPLRLYQGDKRDEESGREKQERGGKW